MKAQGVIAAIVGLALPLLATQVQAAEIKVLASTAVKTTLEELAPQFEKATGSKVDVSFAPASVLKEKIDQAQPSTLPSSRRRSSTLSRAAARST
jgi:molybdate transport system substrate-binding protein